MRYGWILGVFLLLSTVGFTQERDGTVRQNPGPTARSVAEYYRAVLKHEVYPGPESYEGLRSTWFTDQAFRRPSPTQQLNCVVDEIQLMLEALGLTEYAMGLEPGSDYPYKLEARLQGKIPPGVIWVAACHGVVRSHEDRFAYYYSPAEYMNWQTCPPSYSGPLHRPPYARRNLDDPDLKL